MNSKLRIRLCSTVMVRERQEQCIYFVSTFAGVYLVNKGVMGEREKYREHGRFSVAVTFSQKIYEELHKDAPRVRPTSEPKFGLHSQAARAAYRDVLAFAFEMSKRTDIVWPT